MPNQSLYALTFRGRLRARDQNGATELKIPHEIFGSRNSNRCKKAPARHTNSDLIQHRHRVLLDRGL
ncbi:Uncharacterised protein [Vibrio cholerae]|nr:Uncharacterised protein [Vibrio cholerae]CSI85915.1 Uncharacterised protein [Vibrio cholerae]